MNKKTLRILEFNRIIEMLVDKASSPLGKEVCSKLSPMTDQAKIIEAQKNTADAVGRLLRDSRINFQGNYKLRRSFKNLELEGTISQGELLRIACLIECSDRALVYGKRENEDDPVDSLTESFEGLTSVTALGNEIRRVILSEDEIADDASPELKRIRRAQLATSDKIHSELNKMVSNTYRNYLQDNVITMRNNRYCIPVKAEYKSQISGMIHDQSKAGSTYFIEPAAVVELNNKMAELKIDEQEEIYRILRALSAKASEHVAELKINSGILTELDMIFAKGLLALSMNATEPVYTEGEFVDLRKCRHPLIDKNKVVPVDIRLGEDFDLLVVTGPNTGGKTVSLKTVGLMCAMGQTGLHIPAASNSRLKVYNDIFADIGDEQSIEQNLSTFSAHMTNIISILKYANDKSLCLFDELCAGTDPTEGAALAISILKTLLNKKVHTMSTTHYSELKVFALSTERVENAGCEFSVESLSPTYKLIMGIPGKSNAFAISGKLGLPNSIIEGAKEELTENSISFEDLLTDLDSLRKSLEKEQLNARKYREEIEALHREADAKNDRLNEQKERILREANEEAALILEEAKEEADRAIRLYNKGGDIKDMEKMRTNLRNKMNDRAEAAQKKEKIKEPKVPVKKLNPSDIKKGMTVSIISMQMTGVVQTLPDSKGNVMVKSGFIQTKANLKDLAIVETPLVKEEPKKNKSNYSGSFSKAATISPEINLLGMTTDEAVAAVDKYIDDAYMSHLNSVRVVHGKGTGALRDAIHRYLRKQPNVKNFHLAEYGEGDAGVTIVEF